MKGHLFFCKENVLTVIGALLSAGFGWLLINYNYKRFGWILLVIGILIIVLCIFSLLGNMQHNKVVLSKNLGTDMAIQLKKGSHKDCFFFSPSEFDSMSKLSHEEIVSLILK